MLQKLESLVAVLEVTQRKLNASLASPSANSSRLNKVRMQVQNTLAVCRNAQRALSHSEVITAEEISQVDLDELLTKLGNL